MPNVSHITLNICVGVTPQTSRWQRIQRAQHLVTWLRPCPEEKGKERTKTTHLDAYNSLERLIVNPRRDEVARRMC